MPFKLMIRCNKLMIMLSLSLLVMPMLITLTGWSQSLLLIDMGVMLLIFAIFQVASSRCTTHIASNRFDLVMTDVPDIVDLVVGTPLGTSDHCFVSCVLHVEQSVSEYNVRSTVIVKHRTNWDSVHSAFRSFTWSTILKSADPLVAFDRAIGEVIGRYIPTTVFRSGSGDKLWLDVSCRRTFDVKQTAYLAWYGARNAEHWGQLILCLLLLRPRGSMVLQGSRIMSAPGIFWSTPPVNISLGSHWKAWSLVLNLQFLLSGGPEVVWWWLLLRKPHSWSLSLTTSSFVSSFSLLCLVFLSLRAILFSSELLYSSICFAILIRMGVLIIRVSFLCF